MAEGTSYDVLSSNAEGIASDLLFEGTKVFPSAYALQRRVWRVLAALPLCVLISAASGGSAGSGGGAAKAFLALGLIGTAACCCIALGLHRLDLRVYGDQVAMGAWLQGVFVFPSGDVVVRFNQLFKQVEREFPSDRITLAKGSDHDGILWILYSDLSGRKHTYNVDGKRLVDPPSLIAAAINNKIQQHAAVQV